jgi:hypothetical protein
MTENFYIAGEARIKTGPLAKLIITLSNFRKISVVG